MATFPSDSIRTKNWGTEVLTDSDLESQYDIIHNYIQAALNSSTGHTHDGTSNQGPKIPITNLTVSSQAQGDLIYASGATAWARLGAGTAGYLLKTQGAGANPAWVDITADTSYLPTGTVVQVVNTITGAVSTGTTTMPYDDTIPQNTEGDQYMTLAITPKSATNKLKIEVVFYSASSSTVDIQAALFQDSTAGALAAGAFRAPQADTIGCISFTHYMTSGTTSATTFKVRAGAGGASTLTFNGVSASRKLGGVLASSITITEIKA